MIEDYATTKLPTHKLTSIVLKNGRTYHLRTSQCMNNGHNNFLHYQIGKLYGSTFLLLAWGATQEKAEEMAIKNRI